MKVIQILAVKTKYFDFGENLEGTTLYALTDEGAIWAQFAGESDWKPYEKAGFLEEFARCVNERD